VDNRSLDPILAYGVDGLAPCVARVNDEWEIKVSSDLSKSPEPIVLSLELALSLRTLWGEVMIIETRLTNSDYYISLF
jgi:hypothetical protein